MRVVVKNFQVNDLNLKEKRKEKRTAHYNLDMIAWLTVEYNYKSEWLEIKSKLLIRMKTWMWMRM